MKVRHGNTHLVTQARPSRSEDIASRQRRYLAMMAFRLVCFIGAIVLFVNGAGWLAGIPAVGAIVIPYFAVVFANGGREPSRTRGFREYQPNLPVLPTGDGAGPADSGTAQAGDATAAPGNPGPGAAPGNPAPGDPGPGAAPSSARSQPGA